MRDFRKQAVTGLTGTDVTTGPETPELPWSQVSLEPEGASVSWMFPAGDESGGLAVPVKSAGVLVKAGR